jgi:DNA-binding response OmpR family regulator/thioredoxin-like negative regulator of GroEL
VSRTNIFAPDTKVLLIEASATTRKLFTDTLKSFNINNIQPIDSHKTGMEILEVEPVDWIICNFGMLENVNIFHLLDTLLIHKPFKGIRVSAFPDEPEYMYLPHAFERGLFSWHRRDFTRDGLKNQFIGLQESLKKHSQMHLGVSVDYLGETLYTQAKNKSILNLFQVLTDKFPDNTNFLLDLALAYLQNQKLEEGSAILSIAKEKNALGWQQLAKQFLPGGKILETGLEVSNVVMVDPDEMSQKHVKDLFEKYTNVKCRFFLNSEEALAAIKLDPSIDLILQEWKIPKISGPIFIQRVRNTSHNSTPVIVLSSLTSKEDIGLINEMGVSTVLNKPIYEPDLTSAIKKAARESKKPTEYKTLERKIFENFELGQKEMAMNYAQKVLGSETIAEPHKKFVQALSAFYYEKFEAAKTYCVEALQKGADPLRTTHLLGQILTKQGDFEGACKCFRRAQSLSPKNVDRLCEIAEAENELGHTEEAQKALEAAKAIDPTNEKVLQTETKFAIDKGQLEKAKRLMMGIGNLNALVADMNNTAVSYIKNGDFEEGLNLYESTLKTIPDDKTELKMKVSYNLALAYVRQQKVPEALRILKESPEQEKYGISKKISSLLLKVENHLSGKEKLSPALFVQPPKPKEDGPLPWEISLIGESGGVTLADALDIKSIVPGEYCCFPIFESVDPHGFDIASVRKNPPKFKLRTNVDKEEP